MRTPSLVILPKIRHTIKSLTRYFNSKGWTCVDVVLMSFHPICHVMNKLNKLMVNCTCIKTKLTDWTMPRILTMQTSKFKAMILLEMRLMMISWPPIVGSSMMKLPKINKKDKLKEPVPKIYKYTSCKPKNPVVKMACCLIL